MLSTTLRLLSLCTILIYITPLTTHAQVDPGNPNNFITTWDTTNPGTSANNQITIPGTGSGYNYAVYWESTTDPTATGTVATTTANSLTITFPDPGIYRVEIAGDFPRIFLSNSGDRQKILQVNQWGSIVWSSMEHAFWGASNLRVPAIDAPNLSNVTSMRGMFQAATAFNDPIEHWDVSNVRVMDELFENASNFNQPLNNWDTSSTTVTKWMFARSNFNQPLDKWDMSQVREAWVMFRDSPFNQPINTWDVSSLQHAGRMFQGTPFNQPLDNWDTQSLKFMQFMFAENESFNQDLSAWDISSTTNMPNMFRNAGLSTTNLDATLTSWATQASTSNIQNIPLHLGRKTYSTVGAAALDTLRSLGWTIEEQYQAQYSPGTRATLIGTGTQAPVDSGATTTSVTIRPDRNCTFVQWSDGNTDNPRSDTLTDNLSVTADVRCSRTGTSARTQAERGSDQTEAVVNTTPPSPQDTPPETLEDSLDVVRSLPDTINAITVADRSPETIRTLIEVLFELVQALTLLLMQGEREDSTLS